MNIYEIDRQIAALLEGSIDEETGEIIFNEHELSDLVMAREEKIVSFYQAKAVK